jgi:hypothetical protein
VTGLVVRAVERLHGHLGWLSALALAHPAVLLGRRPRRDVAVVATAATVLVTIGGGLGAALYPHYRAEVKPRLFAASTFAGELFERKEHLGAAVLVLAWTGLALLWARRAGDAAQIDCGRLAFVAYAGAATLALVVASAGLLVAAHASF